mgnify:CR=1 FL=1
MAKIESITRNSNAHIRAEQRHSKVCGEYDQKERCEMFFQLFRDLLILFFQHRQQHKYEYARGNAEAGKTPKEDAAVQVQGAVAVISPACVIERFGQPRAGIFHHAAAQNADAEIGSGVIVNQLFQQHHH